MEGQQPGQTISPGAPQPIEPAVKEPAPEFSVSNPPESQQPSPELPADSQPSTPPSAQSANPDPDVIEWTSSEFIAHHKSAVWYVMVGVVVVLLAGLLYWLTRDKITTSAILVIGAVFGYFGTRKPRTLSYRLDKQGLTIGHKFYGFGLFKSFSLIDEGALSSIYLLPMQRFMPAISLYCAPEDEDKITDMLSAYLPYEERKQDSLDRLMHRIRF